MPPRKPTATAVYASRTPRLEGRDKLWDIAPPAVIQHYHSRSGAHRPKTTVRLLWDEEALYVRFDVSDTREELVARYTEPNGPMYRDSCVEVFIGGRGDTYVNCEMNCLGGLLVQSHGKPRQGEFVDPAVWDKQIKRWTSVRKASLKDSDLPGPFEWSANIRLPFALIRSLLDAHTPSVMTSDGAFTAGGEPHEPNEVAMWTLGLFKCADDAPKPHWGAWANIGERLDFHQPSKFGSLLLQRRPERAAKRARL